MLRTIIKPWWVIMLMGIMLIFCAILMFKNPEATMVVVAVWMGALVFLAGLAGMAGYLAAERDDRHFTELLVGAAITVLGLLMLSKVVVTITAITLVFGCVVLANGLWLLSAAWRLRPRVNSWWLIAVLGLVVTGIGIKSLMNIQSGVEAISNLLGIGALLSGLGLLVLGAVKRRVVNKVKEKVQDLRDKLK